MRAGFAASLRCPRCGKGLELRAAAPHGDVVSEGILECPCGTRAPVIQGLPRVLPPEGIETLISEHPDFFARHPGLVPPGSTGPSSVSNRTSRAFADEWQRFPELLPVHREIFGWYFEGPTPVDWASSSVLDAGCGMGRWLHFARAAGATIVGMDVSAAIEVAAAREGQEADFVQADLREPPFAPASFDLVYCLGVVHHLEDPMVGVRALANLVRPGGELRLYVYRTLDEDPLWRRLLFGASTLLRRVTTRLPFWAVHVVALGVSVLASVLFLWLRRLLRRWSWGDRVTRNLPLTQYTDVPFRMLVAEQFDRLVAPIEGRYSREAVEGWLREVGFEIVEVLPGLGWRAIGRRPTTQGVSPEGA